MERLLYTLCWNLLVLIFVVTGCSSSTLPPSDPLEEKMPVLRVLIMENVTSCMVSFPSSFVFQSGNYQETGRGRVSLSIESNYLVINGVFLQDSSCRFVTEGFRTRQGSYRGNLFVLLTNSQILLINEIDIENYLYSVVPSEVSPEWPKEALKAQAVAARTYALYEMVNSRQKNLPFDVYADTRSQVYKGDSAEHRSTSLAVDETRGEVIRYQGRIIPAYFHASSGGFTENSEEVFGTLWPYLRSVPSPYYKVYPQYEWKLEVPLSTLSKKLGMASIKQVEVVERTPSQRLKLVQFTDEAGRILKVPGTNLRTMLGYTAMKSTRANIRLEEEKLVIYGVGYGHGVGMAQWDAYGMALAGKSYREILGFFYIGTQIDRLW
ncbi:SpoIID/LytB domain-containing protein [Thermospira aquatica]|uniref:SpoIID/LytB domain-containing protein n=1 Tax=Thermospira aquatica TaxID=2828656 RepID=A0AAX3BIP2_9SPIR|nr:SpoIID/LytB domain-containing protein [Thermospira aquatica]URA11221.1 SpoIID/LytB domain-containing protein [Thermospira aquatica]